MTRRPKDIGTAAETAVVRYLQESGFPHAERRALHGNTDLGDITGTPGLAWEVKAGETAMTASDNQIIAWLLEAEAERANAGAELGTLVVQRRRKNVRDWWAVSEGINGGPVWQRLRDHAYFLRRIGYGNPITGDETGENPSQDGRNDVPSGRLGARNEAVPEVREHQGDLTASPRPTMTGGDGL